MNGLESEARKAGEAITEKSIAIIKSRLGPWPGSSEELELVVRVAHTTGDVECAKTLLISPAATAAGIAALRSGCAIVTDVTMVLAGLRKRAYEAWACAAHCLLEDEEARSLAAACGLTKSAAAMRIAAARGLLDGAIVAIGNAPTALYELLALCDSAQVRPALIIGVPVGFVGAAESKEALAASDYAHITLPGERGGSPIAAALVNGIAALAAGDGRW